MLWDSHKLGVRSVGGNPIANLKTRNIYDLGPYLKTRVIYGLVAYLEKPESSTVWCRT